jgi:hypothetical protein
MEDPPTLTTTICISTYSISSCFIMCETVLGIDRISIYICLPMQCAIPYLISHVSCLMLSLSLIDLHTRPYEDTTLIFCQPSTVIHFSITCIFDAVYCVSLPSNNCTQYFILGVIFLIQFTQR